MCRYNLLLICLSVFIFNNIIFPQDPPIEWEEIPMADLQMTSFPKDTNASAVVLCDYGETRLNDELELVYTRHIRVKVLNENGYRWGTHSIYIYSGKYGERLDDLEGLTYSLDENGEIKETELDDDNIFKEEVTEDRIRYKFTMPALIPGCVLEIRYKIVSTSLANVKGWEFQDDEPVLWSEYRLIYPVNISFAAVSMGYQQWFTKETTKISQTFRGTASVYLGNIVECNQVRWIIKDAPAFRDEPYITTKSDYINKLDIQLAGYSFIQTGYKKVLQDWKTLCNDFLDSKYFGDMIDVTGNVEKLTKEITQGLTSSIEKMEAIYNWVAKSVVWTEEERIYADNDVNDVLEFKKGSNAEITFLLLSMLKSVGIESDPVILSTRSNGKIQEIYPIRTQFDYSIARVKIGSQFYFLDATDPFRTYDLLPQKVLNVKGLVIKEDSPEWVIIPSKSKNISKSLINIDLAEDGSLKANFEEVFGEYKSLSLRKDLTTTDELELVKDLYETESSGITIDSVKIFAKDSIDSPFKVRVWINSSSYSQVGGDFIYLNPTLINKMTDNPFKANERLFPIDYGFTRGYLAITNIDVPEGYEVKEKYGNKSIDVGKSASYKRIVEVKDNHIQILNKLDIKEIEILPKYYKDIKDFYSRVIQAQSEMLVLGKKEVPAAFPQSGDKTNEGTK